MTPMTLWQGYNPMTEPLDVVVNGVKNKLSDAAAGYPNGNDCFRYQFLDTSEDELTTA